VHETNDFKARLEPASKDLKVARATLVVSHEIV
jgi:hypothetical protein